MNHFNRDQSHKTLPGPNTVINYLILKFSFLEQIQPPAKPTEDIAHYYDHEIPYLPGYYTYPTKQKHCYYDVKIKIVEGEKTN